MLVRGFFFTNNAHTAATEQYTFFLHVLGTVVGYQLGAVLPSSAAATAADSCQSRTLYRCGSGLRNMTASVEICFSTNSDAWEQTASMACVKKRKTRQDQHPTTHLVAFEGAEQILLRKSLLVLPEPSENAGVHGVSGTDGRTQSTKRHRHTHLSPSRDALSHSGYPHSFPTPLSSTISR